MFVKICRKEGRGCGRGGGGDIGRFGLIGC